MDPLDVKKIFIEAGAVLEGHFLLTSGLHSPTYWEKFKILQYPQYTEKLCRMIADHFRSLNIQVVAGPTVGGVILAYEAARQLGVRGIFAEREGQERTFRRGLTISPRENVLVVDDILTTGSSIRETVSAVNKAGGKLAGIGVLVDRSEQSVNFGVPMYSCLKVPVVNYQPAKCPLCAVGKPLVKPGSSVK